MQAPVSRQLSEIRPGDEIEVMRARPSLHAPTASPKRYTRQRGRVVQVTTRLVVAEFGGGVREAFQLGEVLAVHAGDGQRAQERTATVPLSDPTVREIVDLYNGGLSYWEIAKRTGLLNSRVARIVRAGRAAGLVTRLPRRGRCARYAGPGAVVRPE